MKLSHSSLAAISALLICVTPLACSKSDPSAQKTPSTAKQTEVASAPAQSTTQPKPPPPPGEAQSNNNFDTAFITEDFCAALVIHPRQIANSGMIPPELLDQTLTWLDLSGSGVEGVSDIRQIVMYVDPTPGGNVAFFPAGVIRFAKPVANMMMLVENMPGIREQPFLGKKYYTSIEAGMAGVALAAFPADDQTLVIAPEPTLQQMLTAKDVDSPLTKRLTTMSLASHVLGVFAVGPVRETVKEIFDQQIPADDAGPLSQFRPLPELTDVAQVSIDLVNQEFLEIELDGKDAVATKQLQEIAGTALIMTKQMLGQLREEVVLDLPEEMATAATDLIADLESGVNVRSDNNRVRFALSRPQAFSDRLLQLEPLFAVMMASDQSGEFDPSLSEEMDEGDMLDTDHWTPIAIDDVGIIVKFPGDPQYTMESEEGIEMEGFQLETPDKALFGVLHWEVAEGELGDSREAAIAALLESMTGDPESGQSVTVNGITGRQHMFQVEEDGQEVNVMQRLFFANNRVYQVFVQAAVDNMPWDDAQTFLQSIQFDHTSEALAGLAQREQMKAPDAGAWKSFTADDKSYQISFPGEPDEVNDIAFYADYDTELYLTLERMNATIPPSEPDRCQNYFDVVVSRNSEDSGEKLISDEKTAHLGFPARYYVVGHDDREETTEHRLVFISDDKQWHLTAQSPGGDESAVFAKTFFDSLKLPGIESAPAGNAMADAELKSSLRMWTDSTGNFRIEAELVETTRDTVKLKRPNGTTVDVPIARLSAADKEYLRDAAPLGDMPLAKWERYTNKEAAFSVEYPGTPEYSTEGSQEEGFTHVYGLLTQPHGISYAVNMDIMPEDVVAEGPQAVLNSIMNASSEIISGHRRVELSGHPGIEMNLAFEEDGAELVGKTRVYLVGSKLLQAMAICEKDQQHFAEFDRFLNSFRILIEAPKEEPLPQESVVSGRTYKLGPRSRWPAILERAKAVADRDGLRIGRSYVKTRQAHFLTRDFRFEAVFALSPTDPIVFVGIGEGRPGGGYKEPHGSVHMRIHHEAHKSGVGLATSGQIIGTRRIGRDLPTGTHRAVITKLGDAVTFAIDVDNDGPSPDDMELTVANIKGMAPYLTSKNTRLFFGGGGAFREIRLTYDPPPEKPTEPVAATTPKPSSPKQPEPKEPQPPPKPTPPTPSQSNTTTSEPAQQRPQPSDQPQPLAQGKPWPTFLQRSGTLQADGLRAGNSFIRTTESGFHQGNFQLEVVFRFSPGEEQLAFGIGDSQGKCVKLQVNAPDSRFQGAAGLWKHGYKKRALAGAISGLGPHRVIINKANDKVTFAIDEGNNGKVEMSRTITTFAKYTKYLSDSNAHLFFGHGGTYTQINLKR